jgi:putative ABC transport system ATP-binding protein
MNVLELKKVNKIYDGSEVHVHAVNDVALSFQEGEFAAIVGPSGSGKTTLLNLIGGLDMPTSGEIIIGGTDLSKLRSSQLIDFRMRNIGFVFQSYNLIPVLSARENVEFIMSLQKWPAKEKNERTMELLRAVGLSDRMNSRPSRLSGGQQQRVAVARALASHPKFVLADEPTANLDSRSASTLLEIMEKLNHAEKTTFIFSTHDPRVVRMAHRVITLEDGKVISDEVLAPRDHQD